MSGIRKFQGFVRDTVAAAAVEFAFLAPILLLLIAGISDGAILMLRKNSMHSGVSSSAQYIMSGGTNLTTATSVGLSSWPMRTDKASFSATKSCYCGATAADCSTLCTADSSVPKAYVTIQASDVVDGWYGTATVNARQEVRVR